MILSQRIAVVLIAMLSAVGCTPKNQSISDTPKTKIELAGLRDCSAGDMGPAGIIGGLKLNNQSRLASGIVMVLMKESGGKTTMCTGSLITKDIVLLAAHCLASVDEVVALFSTDFLCDISKKQIVYSSVENFLRNPDYDDKDIKTSNNDFALLKLNKDAPAGYSSVSLDFSDSIPLTQLLIAVGYGRTSSQENDEDPMLRWTPISFSTEYKNENDPSAKSFWLVDNSKGHAICKGDSGGPLLKQTSEGFKQIGVASFVFNTNDKNDFCAGAGAYVRMSSGRDWLRANFYKMKSRYPNPF